MPLGVTLSRCVCVHRGAYITSTARRISLGGEGNALYPVLSTVLHCEFYCFFIIFIIICECDARRSSLFIMRCEFDASAKSYDLWPSIRVSRDSATTFRRFFKYDFYVNSVSWAGSRRELVAQEFSGDTYAQSALKYACDSLATNGGCIMCFFVSWID